MTVTSTKNLIVQHPDLLAQTVELFARVAGKPPHRQLPGLALWLETDIDPVQLVRLAQSQQVDAQCVPANDSLSNYRVLACDMDSTLITVECIDEVAKLAGQGAAVAAVTESAMRGEIDFSTSLRERVGLLKGAPASCLQQVLDEHMPITAGADQLIAAARQAGLTTIIISGGFHYFAQPLANQLGIDRVVANTLEISNDQLTGRLAGPLIDANAKREAVIQLCNELDCDSDKVIAVGDGANDLPMMSVAGISVAYKAKPIVRSESTRSVSHCGLDAILNFFG